MYTYRPVPHAHFARPERSLTIDPYTLTTAVEATSCRFRPSLQDRPPPRGPRSLCSLCSFAAVIEVLSPKSLDLNPKQPETPPPQPERPQLLTTEEPSFARPPHLRRVWHASRNSLPHSHLHPHLFCFATANQAQYRPSHHATNPARLEPAAPKRHTMACTIGPTAAGETVSPLSWAKMLALGNSRFYNRSRDPSFPKC